MLDITSSKKFGLTICCWTLVIVFLAITTQGFIGHSRTECKPRSYIDPDGQKCKPPCETHRDCKEENTTCRCDGKCGLSCVDENARCPTIGLILNGQVESFPPVFNSKATHPYDMFAAIANISCSKGYALEGNSVLICQGDKRWSNKIPWCMLQRSDRRQLCRPPPKVANAFHDVEKEKTSFKLGESVTYTCFDGYTPNHDKIDKAWCVRGAKWMGPVMNCTRPDCAMPPHPKNGLVYKRERGEKGIRVNGTVIYTCNTGFFLVGSEKRRCQHDGSWNVTAPICERVVCGPPKEIDHATHDGPQGQFRYMDGHKLSYKCGQGYLTSGRHIAICDGDNGFWKGPHKFSCEAINCGDPGDIPNGNKETGYVFVYPTQVRYYCNQGFELIGPHSRACQVTGNWSAPPTCKPIRCLPITTPINGFLAGTETEYGSIARIICNDKFKVVGSAERTCEADGKWSGQPATCEEIDCHQPGPIWNGYLDGHRTTIGSIYFFRCKPRTKFNGTSFETRCMDNGLWSIQTPICLGQCEVSDYDKTVKYQSVSQGTFIDHGGVIEPICDNGNVISDGRPMRCNNGTWTIRPKCVPAPCRSRPPLVENGHRVFFKLAHGAKARYFCFAGYQLVNDKKYMYCRYGKWDGKKPVCEQRFCSHPGNLKNGQIYKIGIKGLFPFKDYIYSIKHGERLRYECDRDHRLVGPRGAACLNGNWSPRKQPKCLKSRHPPFNKMSLWRPNQERHSRMY